MEQGRLVPGSVQAARNRQLAIAFGDLEVEVLLPGRLPNRALDDAWSIDQNRQINIDLGTMG